MWIMSTHFVNDQIFVSFFFSLSFFLSFFRLLILIFLLRSFLFTTKNVFQLFYGRIKNKFQSNSIVRPEMKNEKLENVQTKFSFFLRRLQNKYL